MHKAANSTKKPAFEPFFGSSVKWIDLYNN